MLRTTDFALIENIDDFDEHFVPIEEETLGNGVTITTYQLDETADYIKIKPETAQDPASFPMPIMKIFPLTYPSGRWYLCSFDELIYDMKDEIDTLVTAIAEMTKCYYKNCK